MFNAVFNGAFGKHFALFRNFVAHFFTHNLTQLVRTAHGVAAQCTGDVHNLLLINHNAVGFLKNRLQLRMQVSNVFFPVLAFDIARNIVHRARAVEGNDSDKVFKTVRLDLLVNVFHAGRFKLEHRGSIAALQQFVGRAVIQIDIVHIQLNAVHFFNPVTGAFNHGQGFQAEKVKLNQAGFLDIFHIILGHRHIRLRIFIKRNQLVKRAVADNHAGSMDTGLAIQSFQFHRNVKQFIDLRVVLTHFFQLRNLIERFLQGRIFTLHAGRNHFADAVCLSIGHLQHTGHVTNHRFGLQLTVGNNLRHMVKTVFVLHIFNGFVAVFLTEIDVEIRHVNTFRIKKTFKQQIQFQRIKVGYF